MKTIFAALLGISVAFAMNVATASAQDAQQAQSGQETTEQKIERLKREGKEYLEQKAKQAAEAKDELKAAIADIKSKYDTKEKRQAAIAEAQQKFADAKERLEKAHEEKCAAVRTDCDGLYPNAKLKNRACRLWNGCYR